MAHLWLVAAWSAPLSGPVSAQEWGARSGWVSGLESACQSESRLAQAWERASARGLALVLVKVWETVSEMGSVQMMGKASEMARAQTWETVSETSLARVWVKASVQVSEPRSETASVMVWAPPLGRQ